MGLIKALLDEHSVNSARYAIGDFIADTKGKFFNELTHMCMSGSCTLLDVTSLGVTHIISFISAMHATSRRSLIILYAMIKVSCWYSEIISIEHGGYMYLITTQFYLECLYVTYKSNDKINDTIAD